jgi:hypothetical protein
MLVQGTWALAGTTGNISGYLTDSTNGKPIADARVTAVAPSQSATTTTDAGGHFIILSLQPDTYTVSADKSGYAPISVAGITVFADQTQTVAITTHPELKTIARVTSRAAANLVKPGVTSDTYSVNSAAVQAAAALGGGGNLDNAYSAIASVPGVNVPVGGAGWNNNAVFIRGNQSFFTSYEYDGVPVNRAFDNYNSSTESNLGLQELQVYTGGGPASNSSAGTSGFINQVIKTGTYPGFGTLNGGLGMPTFYHQARAEAGGASPNRNFSYYVGISGTNQGFNYFDRSNGTSLTNLGGELDFLPQWTSHNFFTAPPGTTGRGDWAICQPGTNLPPAAVASLPWWATSPVSFLPAQGAAGSCFIYDQPAWLISQAQPAYINDRENVVNLHFGIPHPNGLRDDVQVLWSSSALATDYWSSANDAGGLAAYTLAVTGSPYAPGVNYPSYVDSNADYNLPFGTPVQPGGVLLPTSNYLQPSSTENRAPLLQLPADLRDTIHNDTGIVKLQYTKSLGSNAYARLFGYTFYSDWTQAGANSSFNCYAFGIGGPADCNVAANYDLITHTGGGEIQLADQLTSHHLLQLTANYTQASITRFNNTGFIFDSPFGFGGSPVGYVANVNGTYECFTPLGGPGVAAGSQVTCQPGPANAYQLFGSTNGGYWGVAGTSPLGGLLPGATTYPAAPAGTPAALAGAQWISLQNGNTYGTFNTVKPKFLFTSLTDEFRPSDKWDFNVGVRWDRYEYDLAPLAPGTTFYAQVISQAVCQNAAGQVLTTPLAPGQPPPAPVVYTTTCPSGYFHPAFSASSPSTDILQAISPRGQFTYTVDPLTVIRGEVGRYTQPPISASLQYLNSSGNALTVWNATLPLGFHTPFHPIPLMSSIQSDLSIEHQFKGTQISAKISPFFNYTSAYQQQSFIGPNFVTQVPVGAFRSYGVEAALSDGDVNREGISGTLAFTYTQAQVQYQSTFFNNNQLDNPVKLAIANYNSLTKAGGGSQCYTAGAPGAPGVPTSCSTAGAILNPYYNSPLANTIDQNGWYPPGSVGLSPTNNVSTFYFDSPFVTSLILNYKHDRFSITPSFQVSEGSSYGGPFDITGLDPRACGANSAASGITVASPNTNPNQCNYLTLFAGNVSPNPVAGQLFIPNPVTGAFSKPGQFRNPWLALLNVQLRYDFSPKVTGIITLADVWHTCFGGSSEPWTKAYPPSANVCGYYYNPSYVSNFYNGTAPSDAAANGVPAQTWIQQPYLPAYALSVGSGNPFPFNAFFQLQVKV